MSKGISGAGDMLSVARASGASADASVSIKQMDKLEEILKGLDSETLTTMLKIDEGVELINVMKNLPPDDFTRLVANNKVFIDVLNKSDAGTLAKLLDDLNPDQMAKLGKKMDRKVMKKLKTTDAALHNKLNPGVLGRLKIKKNRIFFKGPRNRADLLNVISENSVLLARIKIKPPKNLSKNADELLEQADEMAAANKLSKQDLDAISANNLKLLQNGSESSNLLKTGLKELGYPLAVGGIVIVLLCMAYDTDNPFTAVDRALDDTGTVVRGFKEVADEAAEAVKDTAKGGFDFISFVTNNSWISFSCSILCVILLFALFMMGFLGSMGGGNNKGR